MATVLSDWQSVIVDPIRVPGNPRRHSLDPFSTAGRQGRGEGLLIYSVRDLQGSAHVEINNSRVGTITRASDPSTFRMQLMIFNENTLSGDAGNTITLTDISDSFEIKNMICFYHRAASSAFIPRAPVILADFTRIAGDVPVQVPITHGIARVTLPEPGAQFDTGGRLKFAEAILIFSIRLPSTGAFAQVFVNNHLVGEILGSQSDEFRTQLITFTGDKLNGDRGKNNTLMLGNTADAFEIKDVVCFFHQAT